MPQIVIHRRSRRNPDAPSLARREQARREAGGPGPHLHALGGGEGQDEANARRQRTTRWDTVPKAEADEHEPAPDGDARRQDIPGITPRRHAGA